MRHKRERWELPVYWVLTDKQPIAGGWQLTLRRMWRRQTKHQIAIKTLRDLTDNDIESFVWQVAANDRIVLRDAERLLDTLPFTVWQT